MRTDNYGQMIFDESELCHLYLTNPDLQLKKTIVDQDIIFPDSLGLQNVPKFIKHYDLQLSVEDYDHLQQMNWLMPDEYKNMDIAKYILDQCKDDAELQRAGQELLLFQERDMFDLLKYLKYLVDVMRENNVVWGVGRGSSVSSFVLYLIGIHKINSLYYDLSIEEFLK